MARQPVESRAQYWTIAALAWLAIYMPYRAPWPLGWRVAIGLLGGACGMFLSVAIPVWRGQELRREFGLWFNYSLTKGALYMRSAWELKGHVAVIGPLVFSVAWRKRAPGGVWLDEDGQPMEPLACTIPEPPK